MLAGIEVEPALTALLFRPAIPGDAERLQPPAWKRDQVLLQRIDPEGVGDRIVLQRTVGPSVRTMNLSPPRKKVVVTPKCSSEASEKSPSIVAVVAGCIASAWCEPFQASNCAV